MAIAKKAIVWGLFAAGGTISSFVLPAVMLLFLFIASGSTPVGLEYAAARELVSGWFAKLCLFVVISLSLWHAAHRLRVVFHDFGVRRDQLVARAVYVVAAIGTAAVAYYLLQL